MSKGSTGALSVPSSSDAETASCGAAVPARAGSGAARGAAALAGCVGANMGSRPLPPALSLGDSR